MVHGHVRLSIVFLLVTAHNTLIMLLQYDGCGRRPTEQVRRQGIRRRTQHLRRQPRPPQRALRPHRLPHCDTPHYTLVCLEVRLPSRSSPSLVSDQKDLTLNRAPILVVAHDRGRVLRFFRHNEIRISAENLHKFLSLGAWTEVPAWEGPFAPGGDLYVLLSLSFSSASPDLLSIPHTVRNTSIYLQAGKPRSTILSRASPSGSSSLPLARSAASSSKRCTREARKTRNPSGL